MSMIVEQSSLWRIVQQTIVERVFKHATSLGRKSKSEQLTTTRSPTQKTTWRLGTGKEASCRVVLSSLLSFEGGALPLALSLNFFLLTGGAEPA